MISCVNNPLVDHRFFRPKEMLLGTAVTALLIIIITQVEVLRDMQRQYPLLSVGFVILVTYLFLSLIGTVFVFMASLACPVLRKYYM
jgi:hypothetical protein